MEKQDATDDWFPNHILYKAEDNKWILLSKQKATADQLAFKIILAKAYKKEKYDTIESLFQSSYFKSFGKYTGELLKSRYSIGNEMDKLLLDIFNGMDKAINNL